MNEWLILWVLCADKHIYDNKDHDVCIKIMNISNQKGKSTQRSRSVNVKNILAAKTTITNNSGIILRTKIRKAKEVFHLKKVKVEIRDQSHNFYSR